jgi:hypothetical protein
MMLICVYTPSVFAKILKKILPPKTVYIAAWKADMCVIVPTELYSTIVLPLEELAFVPVMPPLKIILFQSSTSALPPETIKPAPLVNLVVESGLPWDVFTGILRPLSPIFSNSLSVLLGELPCFSWSMDPSSFPSQPETPKNPKRAKKSSPAPSPASSSSSSLSFSFDSLVLKY